MHACTHIYTHTHTHTHLVETSVVLVDGWALEAWCLVVEGHDPWPGWRPRHMTVAGTISHQKAPHTTDLLHCNLLPALVRFAPNTNQSPASTTHHGPAALQSAACTGQIHTKHKSVTSKHNTHHRPAALQPAACIGQIRAKHKSVTSKHNTQY
eukprot:1136264-Pelagomonas_calceolata.AAC.5